jgi:hypothetical protein
MLFRNLEALVRASNSALVSFYQSTNLRLSHSVGSRTCFIHLGKTFRASALIVCSSEPYYRRKYCRAYLCLSYLQDVFVRRLDALWIN